MSWGFLYYFLVTTNYMFFFFGMFIIRSCANKVVSAKFYPKDNIIEIFKLNYFGKFVKFKERVSDMRINRVTWMKPYNSLRSQRTNNLYVFKIFFDEEFYDWKLYNYLFPEPIIKQRKKPSIVDTLWEK